MHGKGQGIKKSGVVVLHKNGVTDNATKNVVRIYRTIIINYTLGWTNASDKRLWPMSMAHGVHLHNHNTQISSGMSPEEVFTKSKSSHSGLHNAHPCGCLAYVLGLILQDFNKYYKWITMSRK